MLVKWTKIALLKPDLIAETIAKDKPARATSFGQETQKKPSTEYVLTHRIILFFRKQIQSKAAANDLRRNTRIKKYLPY